MGCRNPMRLMFLKSDSRQFKRNRLRRCWSQSVDSNHFVQELRLMPAVMRISFQNKGSTS